MGGDPTTGHSRTVEPTEFERGPRGDLSRLIDRFISLLFLFVVVAHPQDVRAADPYATALENRFQSTPALLPKVGPNVAALEKGLKEQAQEMSQRPEVTSPPQAGGINLFFFSIVAMVATPIVALVALVSLRRWNRWLDQQEAKRLELMQSAIVQDSFFVELSSHLALNSSGVKPENNPNQLNKFFKLAPTELEHLQEILKESCRDKVEAQQTTLTEIAERLRYLCYSSRHPELQGFFELASALEAFVRQLVQSPARTTASALGTAARSLEVLHTASLTQAPLQFSTTPPPRLLVIDADAVSRSAIVAVLKQTFDEPDLASDVEKGFSLAARQAYEAIFLNVELAGIDVFEFCTKIHRTALNPTTPVILVASQRDFESYAESARRAGLHVVAEPFLPREIMVEALTLVLSSRMKHREANSTDKSAKARGSGINEDPPGRSENAQKPRESQAHMESRCPREEGDSPVRMEPQRLTSNGQGTQSGLDQPAGIHAELGDANPSPREHAEALYRFAPAHLEQVGSKLREATETDDLKVRNELLEELYISVRTLSSEAQRAELATVGRLSAALEALLRKLLERADLCTPSALEAAAVAISLMKELCHVKAEPMLDEPPIQILVVDDDPITRRALAGAVQVAFKRPKTADSGETALAMVGQSTFDVILLDVLMPAMDGFATCEKIRETPQNQHTSIVFVTSQSDLDSRSRASSVGGCGFIPKPFLAAEITLTVLTFALRGRLAKTALVSP